MVRAWSLAAFLLPLVAANVALSATPPRAPAKPKPAPIVAYDFRGATLGMTIDEFKKLAEIAGPVECRSSKPKELIGIEVQYCSRPGDNPFDREKSGFSYEFLPANDGEYRLSEMSLMTSFEFTSAASAALVEKWGEPGGVDQTPGQNGYGARLAMVQARWVSGPYSIELKSPCGSTRYFCIYYRDKGLADAVAARTSAAAKANF